MAPEDVLDRPGSRMRRADERDDTLLAADAAARDARLMTLRDATEALGVSASTVRRWADEGLIDTRRTAGGHRRFRSADIFELQKASNGPSVLRHPGPPREAAPNAGLVLVRVGPEALERVAQSLYERGSCGWFCSDAAAEQGRAWIAALADSLESGDYAMATDASRAYLRHARLGGASLLECHLMLERFTRVLAGTAARHDCAHTEVLALQRLIGDADRVLLADAERS